jgi:hypothetical protein
MTTGAVRLLAVFKDGNKCASHGKSGAVQGMNESGALFIIGPVAYVGPPCLKVLKI